jgi:hypothetical protein
MINNNKIKEVKLNKTILASYENTKKVMPKYLQSKKTLEIAKGKEDKNALYVLNDMISVFSFDLDKNQADLYKKMLVLIGMQESDFMEKRKVANSPVIKSIIKPKSSFQSVARELEKLGLKTVTSVVRFKKEHKVINGELKVKKDLPTNKVKSNEKPTEEKPIEKPKSLLQIIKSLSNEDLNNIIDLASQELAVRGQKSMTI